MSKIIVAGNIKAVKTDKNGNTYLSVWDNYNKKAPNGALEVKSRTIMVWFSSDLMGQYAEGDFIEIEGEPSASSFTMKDDQTGEDKQVAMLNVNNPKVVGHRMDAQKKRDAVLPGTEELDAPF